MDYKFFKELYRKYDDKARVIEEEFPNKPASFDKNLSDVIARSVAPTAEKETKLLQLASDIVREAQETNGNAPSLLMRLVSIRRQYDSAPNVAAIDSIVSYFIVNHFGYVEACDFIKCFGRAKEQQHESTLATEALITTVPLVFQDPLDKRALTSEWLEQGVSEEEPDGSEEELFFDSFVPGF